MAFVSIHHVYYYVLVSGSLNLPFFCLECFLSDVAHSLYLVRGLAQIPPCWEAFPDCVLPSAFPPALSLSSSISPDMNNYLTYHQLSATLSKTLRIRCLWNSDFFQLLER